MSADDKVVLIPPNPLGIILTNEAFGSFEVVLIPPNPLGIIIMNLAGDVGWLS